jgi:hypothetical protein
MPREKGSPISFQKKINGLGIEFDVIRFLTSKMVNWALRAMIYRVSPDGMSISRSERCEEEFNRRLFISFHLLSTCCNAAIHRYNLLIHSQKTASKKPTLISSRIYRTPERSSFADANRCASIGDSFCDAETKKEKVRGSQVG